MCDEKYPRHLMAQKLSNRASFLITKTGKYEEGIVLLTKALQLTEYDVASSKLTQPYEYELRGLESVLGMGHDLYSSIIESERATYDEDRNENKDESLHTSLYDCEELQIGNTNHQKTIEEHEYDSKENFQDTNDLEKYDGFVYRRPLLVNTVNVEGHHMGHTLSVIIMFNLALAHHLKAISVVIPPQSEATYFKNIQMQVLGQALRLYELAYELHENCLRESIMKANDNGRYTSLRFTLIICNNVSEIHRVTLNSAKYKMCLQHLMGIFCMYMVDCRVERMDSNDVDGFYHNLKSIMGNDACANAA